MSLKILTVDDSRTIRMIVKKAFRPFDCEIFEAENGAEGMTIATSRKLDLIILDITMPVMTGIEMLEKLKQDASLKDVPIIMLTAESGKENVMQIIQMGVSNYIVKPFKGEQLIERARKVIELQDKNATSNDLFSGDGELQVLKLPSKVGRSEIAAMEQALTAKIKEIKKLIIDLEQIGGINVSVVKVILQTMQICKNADIPLQIVASQEVMHELKKLRETSMLNIYASVDDARAAFL